MPLTLNEKKELADIRKDAATLRKYLVGDVDEKGEPTNGLIRQVAKIAAQQKVLSAQIDLQAAYRARNARRTGFGFFILALMSTVQIWKLSGPEAAAIADALWRLWPK